MYKKLIHTFVQIKECEENIFFARDSFEKGFYRDKWFPLKERFELTAQDLNLIPRVAWEILTNDEPLWRKDEVKSMLSSSIY